MHPASHGGPEETSCGSGNIAGQQACRCAATQQRTWKRSTLRRWQRVAVQVVWLVLRFLQEVHQRVSAFLLQLQADKITGQWARQGGPAFCCSSTFEHAQKACCGLGSTGPVQADATNRGPGWTGPADAVGNGVVCCGIAKALQRRAAKGRSRSWRGGCRRRACRRQKRTRCLLLGSPGGAETRPRKQSPMAD
eukprot:1202501-Amphidinium_carterae.1